MTFPRLVWANKGYAIKDIYALIAAGRQKRGFAGLTISYELGAP